MPKYPDIQVQLVGRNGNAYNLIGIVTGAMKKADLPKSETDAFFAEATAGDYDNVLQTCMKWVDVT